MSASQTSSPEKTPPGGSVLPTSRGPSFLLRGDVLGRYVVLDKLGSGGMGIVYAAYDPELDRKVAVKLIRPGARGRTEVARARLLREAQALARLSHPGVIAVHDVGTFEDQVFVAMEFVDGMDMAQWLRRARRSWREVLDILRQAGEGLAAAHEAGVIHRDFKPENVLIGRDGRARVLDFGLARTAGPDSTIDRSSDGELEENRAALARLDKPIESTASLAASAAALARLTQAGAVMGTPAYMAPEQHQGSGGDARTDQFSFCVAAYEALYGERPFAGERAPEIAYNVVRGRIREPPREGPAVPAWLRKVLVRGLATEPAQRHPDMRAVLAAFAADPAARQRKIAIAALGLGALAAGGLALSTLRPDEAVCRGAERKLEGIWDATVRGEVEGSFGASTRPYAADAFSSTAALLDAHTTRFVAMHTDACEATAIRKEQSQDMLDRQVTCLERRLKDVRALTRLLAHADDEAVTQAVTAASALPSFEPCADREALMSPGAPPTGEFATRIAELEDRLAAGRQQLLLVRYDDALATARDALAAARETGHLGTIADALMLLGRAEVLMGENAAAERLMREAMWTADEAADDRARARATTDLVWVVALEPTRATEVADLGHSAAHALRRFGGDPLIEAELHNNLGVHARRRNETTTAIAEHERALALRREHVGSDEPKVADSLVNLGNALADDRRFDDADRVLAEAEQILRPLYGDRHPKLAAVLHVRGIVLHRRGDDGTAASLLEQALAIREAALPSANPHVAGSHHDLGEVLLAAGRPAEALTQFTRAVELRTAAVPANNASIANSLTGLGQAELELGRTAEARTTLARALELREGGDPFARAETEFAYARALWSVDRDRALALARGARATWLESAKHEKERSRVDAWLATVQPAEN